ncbi:hypothetical protein SLNWT_2477 [Streptomyces albus]|uniref:Uncharacterized protein n=1 Tax=Streptomyces albus (strain ATCC 21838 / DSM 41398 / FERM P-419 / JCM 4703 / NBRC 107858) TaxID=1081613 RepID=A0A0B5EKQ7_STRA4|nr:hypothetical protein SLNWT_2477 [Streptomyces albus]AOU77164.1 hypothetical protein SLNHY_2473 [Streptomyces albus]AYN32941.1 hypothetical protein DUI70_2440 [Streptomyces albus]
MGHPDALSAPGSAVPGAPVSRRAERTPVSAGRRSAARHDLAPGTEPA